MYATARTVAEFDQLTAALMMSGSDLPGALRRLEETARCAVPSLLGWSLTARVDGGNVTMTSIPASAAATDVRASLAVPLSAFLTGGLEGGMVFYATEPHAFSRWARAFVPVLGPAVCRLRADQDLNPNLSGCVSGARGMAIINRAIGVLVTGGDSADTARDRLQATARAAHLTLHQSALALLVGAGQLTPARAVC